MSDFKFIAFVVFLFIVFGAFMSIFTDSQYKYEYGINESNNETSFDKISSMTNFKTNSTYGTMFIGGLGLLMAIIVIRFARGQ